MIEWVIFTHSFGYIKDLFFEIAEIAAYTADGPSADHMFGLSVLLPAHLAPHEVIRYDLFY